MSSLNPGESENNDTGVWAALFRVVVQFEILN